MNDATGIPATSARETRAWLIAGIALTLAGLTIRLVMFYTTMNGELLAIGPDAGDWVTAAAGIARGDFSVLKPNRYPLYPWTAAQLSLVLSVSPHAALLGLSIAAGALLPWATLVVARRFLSLPGAILVSSWVLIKPAYAALGLSPIAYLSFALAYVVLAGALLGGYGRWGDAVAGIASAAAVALLNQGLLCLLALLPAPWLAGRLRRGIAALAGALAGLWLAEALQPDRNSALGWMLQETRRYLGGNVAEELGRADISFPEMWSRWAEQTFQTHVVVVVLVVLLAVVGLAVVALRGRPFDSARLAGRPVLEAPAWTRRDALGLAWACAPLAVLLPLVASSHHLIHLEPLLAVAAGLGVQVLFSARFRWAPALAIAAAIAAGAVWMDQTNRWEFQIAQAREERAAAKKFVDVVGQEGLVLVTSAPGPSRFEMLWRSAWAMPRGISMHVLPEGPLKPKIPLEDAIARSLPLWVVSAPDRSRWRSGPFVLTATGTGTAVELGGPKPSLDPWIDLLQGDSPADRPPEHEVGNGPDQSIVVYSAQVSIRRGP